MNRHVFIALAVVLGVVVEGLPQHRFRPFRFSFTAGKQDSVSTNVGPNAVPADPPVPIEEPAPPAPLPQEPAPIQEEPILTPVDEAPAIEEPVNEAQANPQVQQLWKKAAMNLVNIPHLLRWVSSLNPETLMATLREQQESVVPRDQTIATETSEPVLPQDENVGIVETVEVVTNLYEPEYTTEGPQIIQEEIMVSEPQVMQEKPIDPVLPESQPIQEMIPSPEARQMDKVPVDQPVAQVEEAVIYAEPEPVQVVVPVEPEPVVESIAQTENVVEAQPMQIEEVVNVQPEPIQEVPQAVQPQEIPREQIWQQRPITQTFEKPSFVENKKTFSKFKSNKLDSRKQQSLKKGKTLFNFAPAAPQESIFSFQAPAFPAYSYSISHTPSHTYYTGR